MIKKLKIEKYSICPAISNNEKVKKAQNITKHKASSKLNHQFTDSKNDNHNWFQKKEKSVFEVTTHASKLAIILVSTNLSTPNLYTT